MKKNKNPLLKYRNELEQIDDKIIALISKRFCLIKKIAIYKQKHSIAIEQKSREKANTEKRLEYAKKLKANSILITKIFDLIINFSKKYQNELIKNHK